MERGTVKWFNNAKGYGFVLSDSGGADLFVHHTNIRMEGFKTLYAGQAVEFEAATSPKGAVARNIRLVSTSPRLGS